MESTAKRGRPRLQITEEERKQRQNQAALKYYRNNSKRINDSKHMKREIINKRLKMLDELMLGSSVGVC